MKQKIKVVDKALLIKINGLSTKQKYNRLLDTAALEKLPDDKVFPVKFAMLHEHRMGKACEPHARTMIYCPTGSNDTAIMLAILDMELGVYELIPEIEVDVSDKKSAAT
jgi:hypothetical protein